MKFVIPLLFFTNSLLSQESKLRILSEQNIGDSLVRQIAELVIFNNTSLPICIRVSWDFRAKILSTDTVELAPCGSKDYTYYDLWVSEEDAKSGVNDLPRYPLILNSRTSFVATLGLQKNLRCKNSWIEYSYISQPDVDYNELFDKYNQHQQWDTDPKLKYLTRRAYLK